VNLSDIPKVDDWLSQFDVPDKYLAEHMLHRIRYVTFEEFEIWLHRSINELIDEISINDGRVAIAIFPVSKPFIHKFNKEKEQKLPNDSAGRIAHSLKNIERDLPSYVELTPRLNSMRKKKVKHVIFVDDFVGTGERFVNSWNSTVPSALKSWCSLGWCKVWFITFAAHRPGIKKILHHVRALSSSRIKINLSIDKSFFLENAGMREVLQKYGTPLGKSSQVMGYGGLASPVIFQYGCPNNVPLIFWLSPSRATRKEWRPIFPNRSIASEVYPLFSKDLAKNAMPEELWMMGHYRLALNIMENISGYGKEKHQLLLILSLLDKGRDLDGIKRIMILTAHEMDALLDQLRQGGAIDNYTSITRFGRDILVRLAKTSKKDVTITSEKNFFPSSFLGFRREA
jgi:hypothetical protein